MYLSIFDTRHFLCQIVRGGIFKLFEQIHSATNTQTESKVVKVFKIIKWIWCNIVLFDRLHSISGMDHPPVEEWNLRVEDFFQPFYEMWEMWLG